MRCQCLDRGSIQDAYNKRAIFSSQGLPVRYVREEHVRYVYNYFGLLVAEIPGHQHCLFLGFHDMTIVRKPVCDIVFCAIQTSVLLLLRCIMVAGNNRNGLWPEVSYTISFQTLLESVSIWFSWFTCLMLTDSDNLVHHRNYDCFF